MRFFLSISDYLVHRRTAFGIISKLKLVMEQIILITYHERGMIQNEIAQV